MSIDVKGTLQQFLVNSGTAIDITPSISSTFGTALGTVISEIFSGSIQVGGVTFALTGDTATAKVTGSGSAAPLVQQVSVSATFTADTSGVTMVFSGTVDSNIPISDAWPSQLNISPFNQLTISGGTLSLTVNPGDLTFNLTISATASFEGTPLGTGLFVVSYDGTALGFLGGFIASGTWTPFSDFPLLKNLTLTGEGGVFVSTITQKDLSAFKSLNLPYLPDEIDPGLTFLGSLTLGGDLANIAKFLPSGSSLDLLANIPPAGVSQMTVTASLGIPTTTAEFDFNELSLSWKSTSPTSGSIELTIGAVYNISSSETLQLTGNGTFNYGDTPALSVDLTISGTGAWTHPFGIPNLTILSFSINLSLSDDGIDLGFLGSIEIGSGGPNPVTLDLGGGVLDFEAPGYIEASLSSESQGKQVTLTELVQDFIPSLDLSSVPLLNDISFSQLSFYAAAVPIPGTNYLPGIGCSGDIQFFGYDLDFEFNLVTNPTVAVKAQGAISENGGPISVAPDGVPLLTMSDATGKLGPTACIDTTGTGYCQGSANDYFFISADITVLGLLGTSILAQASESSFEFNIALGASNIFSSDLACSFVPDQGDFAASASIEFYPLSITLGPWGPIPKFKISTPSISLCLALGTFLPSTAPCTSGWMPTSAPYFHFDLSFSWGPVDFSVSITIDIKGLGEVFTDFATWLENWLLSNAEQVLDVFLDAAKALAQLLLQIGLAIIDVVNAIVKQFDMLFADAWDLVTELAGDCAASIANSAIGSDLSVPDVAAAIRRPQFLVDLTDAEGGQELLYHYYLNVPEWETLLASGSPMKARIEETIAAHRQQGELAEGRYIPCIIDLIRVTEENGSPQYKQSAAEVVQALEKHRQKTYTEFLAAVKVPA